MKLCTRTKGTRGEGEEGQCVQGGMLKALCILCIIYLQENALYNSTQQN